MQATIRTIPISKINPARYNPRVDLKPGGAVYEKLKRSLDTFGCVEALVWNERTGNLVGGLLGSFADTCASPSRPISSSRSAPTN